LPELSALYLWNTGVSEQDFPDLKKQLPQVHLESGFKGDTVVAQLNSAIIEGEEQVFTAFTKVKLKNFIKGAVVRYTLDGAIPDSLGSLISTGDSITIDKTCLLSTKTFLPGWISSEVATCNFYKVGFTPDSITLVHAPNPQYKGEGLRTLINHKIGDTDFRNKKWLGFKDTPLEAFLFFKQPTTLSSVSVSTVVDIGSYILPAAQVEFWGGSSKNNLVLLKKLNPAQPSGLGAPAYLVGFNADFEPRKVSVVQIVVKPVSKLPAWHPGKGTPGWVFVDEVFLN
ncbi:MAG: chitobiase/beta-hexosaminidase C-terminal domain-containing protein, partial [Saprospiraceae bacterium]